MYKKVVRWLLLPIFVAGLVGCFGKGGDDDSYSSSAPYQVGYVTENIYASIRAADAGADTLFSIADSIAGSGKCDVQILRMGYDTVGGAGEPTTSSGVIMLPKGAGANCSGARPTLLYAHGTATDSRYDLSQLIADSSNPASAESLILLALYASRGYIVVAPNYAGFADSTLGYHPYLDEQQQTTEMMDALAVARYNVAAFGVSMSADLFVSGLSQGGYVAMATHKALQAKGESVRASVPISGPYATLDFVDTIMAGYVNGGATVFAPLFLTALEKAHDIYANPTEVYSVDYAATAENALPRVGGFENAVANGILPASALFSGSPPVVSDPAAQALYQMGFGTPHLLSDAFRMAYLENIPNDVNNQATKIRQLVKEVDLRDWTPASPVMMCASEKDPIVYFTNTQKMAGYWTGAPTALTLDLDAASLPAPLNAFMPIAQQWQMAVSGGAISGSAIHGQTGVYCGLAAYGFFQSQRTP